jgi:hypothetical protein
MRLQKGQRWECESRYCGCEIQVLVSSQVEEGMNPRCSCGSMMKKVHVAPEAKAVLEAPTANRKAANDSK